MMVVLSCAYPGAADEGVDLAHADHLRHHAAQPLRVEEVELVEAVRRVVVVHDDAGVMQEPHGLTQLGLVQLEATTPHDARQPLPRDHRK